jgi:long-subunit acyl-CoA synthetase (AMP-forming)
VFSGYRNRPEETGKVFDENVQPEAVEQAYLENPLIREIGVLQIDGRFVAVIVPETAAFLPAHLRLRHKTRTTGVHPARQAQATRPGRTL